MLNQLVARPMSLRRGSSRLNLLGRAFSRLGPSRDLSQAAALAESAGDSGADKGCSLSREERVTRMEAFARKLLTEEGALPTPYVLQKEFGGGRNTALKVLGRIEEDMKTSDSSADLKSQSTDAADLVSSATEETLVSPSNSIEGIDSGKMETEAAAASESNKLKGGSFAASNLWARLHTISQKSRPPAPKADPSKSSSIVLSSESSSEDDEESEVSALDFPEPSMEKNPAQALLQSDLHPRHGLFVKFLDLEATEGDLRAVFKACGEIRRVQINKPRSSSSKYTYGFVDFATEDGLKKALEREYVIRGVKVQTEPSKRSAESMSTPFSSDAKGAKVADGKSVQPVKPAESKSFVDNKTQISKAVTPQQIVKTALQDTEASGYTVSVESIPQSSLPQIVDALSQYGEIINSWTKQYNGGNTTAYIEFKNGQDKDNALAAHHVHLGGKQLKLHRNGPPLTTVVRLSNIPVDSYQKVAVSYKSYGQVDRVEQKMEGIVDIYYNANELKHMTRILDKCNAITVNKRKLRAVPAPVCYPKESLETPAGLKWVDSQKSQILNNLETSLRRAALYVQDLRGLLSIQPVQGLETATTTTTTTKTTGSDD